MWIDRCYGRSVVERRRPAFGNLACWPTLPYEDALPPSHHAGAGMPRPAAPARPAGPPVRPLLLRNGLWRRPTSRQTPCCRTGGKPAPHACWAEAVAKLASSFWWCRHRDALPTSRGKNSPSGSCSWGPAAVPSGMPRRADGLLPTCAGEHRPALRGRASPWRSGGTVSSN